MTNIDTFLSRLNRDFIGVDRVLKSLFEDTGVVFNPAGYPPYNIEETVENQFRITVAVAGFKREDLTIETKDGWLTIAGSIKNNESKNYLHQGIGLRDFKRQFKLAEYVKVKSAALNDGLLVVDLEREVPEAAKPTTIDIG